MVPTAPSSGPADVNSNVLTVPPPYVRKVNECFRLLPPDSFNGFNHGVPCFAAKSMATIIDSRFRWFLCRPIGLADIFLFVIVPEQGVDGYAFASRPKLRLSQNAMSSNKVLGEAL